MRKDPENPDKKIGYVLVPVYLEPDETLEEAIERGRFDVVFEVLQTLREQDEVLDEVLRELALRRTVKGYNDARLNSRLEVTAIVPQVGLEDLIESIRVHCVDGMLSENEQRWRQNYERTLRYREELGRPNVIASEDTVIAAWQRGEHPCRQKRPAFLSAVRERATWG